MFANLLTKRTELLEHLLCDSLTRHALVGLVISYLTVCGDIGSAFGSVSDDQKKSSSDNLVSFASTLRRNLQDCYWRLNLILIYNKED